MKKGILFFVIAMIIATAVSAQSYTVQEVTGRVQKEAGSNRVNITAGETLNADAMIHTGVGASLVLKAGDNTFTVPAARSGMLSELITSASGVRIGGNITRTDATAAGRNIGQISTASARASDAADALDVAAE